MKQLERGYLCGVCGRTYEITCSRWRCDCGGVLSLSSSDDTVRALQFDAGEMTSARYLSSLPVRPESLANVSLGSGRTPLLAVAPENYVKCDHLLPTGSFKDRGAEIVVARAQELLARRIVVDSSGNAGAAIAAHSARAQIPCTVVAPASAPRGKLAQIGYFGAELIMVSGGRELVRERTLSLLEDPHTLYGSHVENPHFTEGTKTWAFEVWEQLGAVPKTVIMAVGNGSLLLGVHLGFQELLRSGLTSTLPRIIAVQQEGWSPLGGSLFADETTTPLADGIAIRAPRRRAQIELALANTGGFVHVVLEEQIARAERTLARRGLWVEPTAAAAYAAWSTLYESGEVEAAVVNLGGAGFKRTTLT